MTKPRVVALTAACALAGAAIMMLVQPPRTEAQSGPTQVRVVNGPARPVLSTLAPEEIFRTVSAIQLTAGSNVASVEFDAVPAGKRLVVESVEVTVKASPGKPLTQVAVRGGVFSHPIALQKQSSTSLWDYYVGTYNVRWYTDPGESLSFSASAPVENNAGSAIANVSITGYFVPVP